MFFSKSFEGYKPFLPLKLPVSVQVAFSLIAAITLTYFSPFTVLLGGISYALLLTSACFKKKISKKQATLLICFFIAGGMRTWQFIHYRTHLFPLYNVTLEGAVESITFTDNKPWCYNSILTVSRIYTAEGWQSKPCIVQIYSYKQPYFHVDDSIHCSIDKIEAPSGDFMWYLYKEGIDATTFQKKIPATIIDRPTYSLKRFFTDKRKQFHKKLERSLKPDTFALFSSLFLGNRNAVKKDLEEQKPLFKVWGIAHFLARSGFHLLIFVMILQKLLSIIPLRFFLKELIILLIALLYTVFSWSAISFNRALYTFLFCRLATLGALPSHSMHVIGFVCSSFLLLNPLQLFFLDFQLTFLLTFCLIWIAHIHHQRRLFYTQKIASV